jgi:hypothetical protein
VRRAVGPLTQRGGVEKIKAWRDGKEFAEIRKVGEKYATFRRGFTVEGVPQ